jgi:formyltetrahydrofolate-dependent phosphoribosylglycinamide formyltransferase
MARPLRVVALLSGGGSTLENLFHAIDAGRLPASIDLVVSSRADAYGLERARRRGVETAVVPSRKHRRTLPGGATEPDWDRFSDALDTVVLPRRPDLVVMAGFMCRYRIPDGLEHRVLNIHPALIPAFCGKGMYGLRVHEAVVAAGVKVTGCTVHFATNEYDAGPIILQRTCRVYHGDTPEDVARRVQAEERIAYPEAVRLFAEGRLAVRGGVVRIEGDETDES